MTIKEIKEKVVPVLKNHDVEFAAVFGSYARGDAKPDSDVDLLVRFNKDISLLYHIGVEHELEDVLRKKVDLATEASLHRLIKSNVMRDLKTVYEKH